MYIDAQECMYMYTSFKGVAVDEKVGERKKKERARKTAFSCIGKLRRREVITKKKKAQTEEEAGAYYFRYPTLFPYFPFLLRLFRQQQREST